MYASWKDFVKKADISPAAIAGLATVGGAGLGWLYDKLRGKKHTARRVAMGAIIGMLSVGGLALLRKKIIANRIANRISPNDPEADLNDLRALWSFQRNYAYRNKRLASSLNEMGDGTGIGKDGFVLNSRIWENRLENGEFSPKRGKSRLSMMDVLSPSGDNDNMSKVLISTPSIPSKGSHVLISLVGPVTLQNDFSFDKEWPTYLLNGEKNVVDLVLGLKPQTLEELKERLDTGDLSKHVNKSFNGLYYPDTK